MIDPKVRIMVAFRKTGALVEADAMDTFEQIVQGALEDAVTPIRRAARDALERLDGLARDGWTGADDVRSQLRSVLYPRGDKQ